eukprot:GGOE01018240.1.p1 GENE.GGOE01018240.1~~GGOE01018240.1.p1  ORF type:complete len:213 (-),score=59.63 GGOE01018240.1:299-937(-)
MDDQKKQQLRRERSTLENEIDQKLLTLCKVEKPSDLECGFSSIEADIEVSLNALAKLNDTLMGLEGTGIAERQQNEHHREILQGYMKDFRSTRGKLKQKCEKEELLKNCRKDIEDFRDSHGMQALGKERDAIGKVNSVANQIMATAQASRERLQQQRSTFGTILDKSGSLIKRLPMVDDIINKIHKKKSRDMIILGFVIGLCLFLMWLYWKD